MASLLVKHGAAVITAAISPYAQARAEARERIGSARFVEVFVRCSLDELVRRDVKGLYEKAIAGELEHFTGVSDPYEAPERPDVVVDSEVEAVEESVSKILAELAERGYLHADRNGDSQPFDLLERLRQGACYDRSSRWQADQSNCRRMSGGERELHEQGKGLRSLTLTGRELNDLALIGIGACSPLTGLMTQKDYEPVVTSMRLSNGYPGVFRSFWRSTGEEAPTLGTRAALYDGEGELRGIIEVEDVFEYDKLREATECLSHRRRKTSGRRGALRAENLLDRRSGSLVALRARSGESLAVSETRAEFERRGWNTIVGFQTRNPVHRAHEYIQKCALEVVDGLLLHPLVARQRATIFLQTCACGATERYWKTTIRPTACCLARCLRQCDMPAPERRSSMP